MFVVRPRAERSTPLQFSPALVERFGLFNILVLAEIFVGVVSGLTHHEHLSATAFITGGLGLCLAFAMWWLYFDFVSHHIPLPSQVAGTTWLYMHLFVTMSIVVVGAAVLNIFEHSGEPLEVVVRWTLVGAIAVYLLSLVPLTRVITVADEVKAAYGRISIILFIAAVVIALLGFTSLATLPLLLIIVGIMLFPVLYALMFWVKMLDTRALRH